jgi:uncharacterized protein YndB with AHSA1/START domain
MENYSVKLSRVYDAPVEKVFKAWIDPTEMDQWHFPDGFTSESKNDPRLGGKYSTRMKETDGPKDGIFEGVYKEFIPNEKIVFTWAWQNNIMGDGETQVTVEFKSIDAKKTELVLTHEMLKSEASKINHAQGWEMALDKLGKLMKT